MSVHELFQMKTQRMRLLAREALSQADMFAAFRFHQPTMSYYDILAAAQNMRECAMVLENMAEKIKPPVRELS